MYISRILGLVMILILLGTAPLYAQFKVTAEIRPRAEFRDGFKTLKQNDQNAAFFVEQRTRLGIGFTKDKLMLKISLQDIRFWGGTSQIYKTDNALFNVNEAWAGYAFNVNHSLYVGRMMLDYDNARILGNLDWAQQGRSHDLVKYQFNNDNGFTLHAGLAYNQETVNSNPEPSRLFDTFYSGVNNYKTMQYAWANKQFENSTLSLLFLSNGYQAMDSTQNFLFTTGGYYSAKQLGPFALTGEAYFQFGEDGANRDVSAYMVAVALSMKLGRHGLTFGVDHLSGTNQGDDKNNSFNPLFGTNHKFYGYMDYFYVGNSHMDVGLTDGFVKFNFNLGEKSSLQSHLHFFTAPVSLEKTDGSDAGSYLGTELDLVYTLKITKDIVWNLGYSIMDPAESMGILKPGNPDKVTMWGWTMIAFKPTLFDSKKDDN